MTGEGPGAPGAVRVLQVLAPAAAGGLERVVADLSAGLAARGHSIHVAAVVEPGDAEHPFVRAIHARGIPAHEIAVPARAYRRERAAVAQLCRELRPDVVHTHGFRPDVVDGRVAARLGIPVASTVHGFTGDSWRVRLYERIQRTALRRFDLVVAVSRALADDLVRSGVPASRVRLIPNAWLDAAPPVPREEARRRLGLAPDQAVVGWIGRLGREKGPDVLVEAVVRLNDVPCAVSVVGLGPMGARLEARARRLGIAERVRWHGLVPEAGRLIPAFDAFVLSSRNEGTPMVLLEAMAAGVPIVATAVGGIPDVVSQREAVLVPPEDPAALASGIRSVFSDLAAAQTRAGAARARLTEAFAGDRWVASYEMAYRELIAARRGTSTA